MSHLRPPRSHPQRPPAEEEPRGALAVPAGCGDDAGVPDAPQKALRPGKVGAPAPSGPASQHPARSARRPGGRTAQPLAGTERRATRIVCRLELHNRSLPRPRERLQSALLPALAGFRLRTRAEARRAGPGRGLVGGTWCHAAGGHTTEPRALLKAQESEGLDTAHLPPAHSFLPGPRASRVPPPLLGPPTGSTPQPLPVTLSLHSWLWSTRCVTPASYFTSLCLTFFVCEMGIMTLPTSRAGLSVRSV